MEIKSSKLKMCLNYNSIAMMKPYHQGNLQKEVFNGVGGLFNFRRLSRNMLTGSILASRHV